MMFGHILTNLSDSQLVQSEWEAKTGKSLDDFTVTHTKVSEITTNPGYFRRILRGGRLYGQLLWIEADIDLPSIHDDVRTDIIVNTVKIGNLHIISDDTLPLEDPLYRPWVVEIIWVSATVKIFQIKNMNYPDVRVEVVASSKEEAWDKFNDIFAI